ncbi:DMT family transporter [Pontibaca sp. S1109L]|uniref:DMT family transporter n=2 Tax=Pontibaca salina TaxID=2795731 RepID=A0A934LZ60_9RHOB|nr:DMT family transporter [Pontibaca salina]
MIVAMLLLPMGDSFSKSLTAIMPAAEVTMWRLLSQAVFLIPVAVVLRRRLHGRMFSPVVALSGLLITITLLGLIGAFAKMPIATAISIFFVEPLLLTLLAGPLLGERVGPRRIAAVVVGLIGALIVIRPGFTTFGFVVIYPLIAAASYALNMIVLRRASGTRSGLTVQCGASAYAGVGMLLAMIFWYGPEVVTEAPATFPLWAWGAIVAAGGLAATSFVLIAEAFRQVEASTLAPFQYLEILGATAVGYMVFGDFPDAMTWLGVAIILASGIYVFYREKKVATAETKARSGGR